MIAGIKRELRELADALPDNATWEDVIDEARFRRAVEAGLRAADRDAFATPEEIRATFKRWGVKDC